MKSKWRVLNLGEVFSMNYGKALPKNRRTPNGKFPVYGASGIKDWSNDYYINKPTLIIGRKGSVGEVMYSEEKFWPLDVTYYLEFNENEFDTRFLFYLLRKMDLSTLAKGVKPGLNREDVYRLKAPFPPFEEQKQIVAILDKALSAIEQAKANVEKNIQNAEELFQSKLNEIFTDKGNEWPEKKIEEVATVTSSKRIFKSEYVNNGVPFYRSKEVKELAHGNRISVELFITRTKYQEIKEKYGVPEKGDLLLTAIGTIGEIHVVETNEEFYFKDGNITWLKNLNSVDPHYLKFALRNFVEELKNLSHGSTYNALTIEKLKKYSILTPSFKEQEEIVNKLREMTHEIDHLEKCYFKKLIHLEELKSSLLQKAFEGELTKEAGERVAETAYE